tara:strand:- start:27 stop:296 length:270 start_codon:yes stop_codon:yes gene_type:complete
MSQLIKIFATEETTGNTSGTATTISGATCVRLFNSHTATVVVGVHSVGTATTSYFSMPTLGVEYLQKKATDVVWTVTNSIKAAKVGFTN